MAGKKPERPCALRPAVCSGVGLTAFQPSARIKAANRGAERICATPHHAEVAELADAHGSGPCARKGVGVRVPSSAPDSKRTANNAGFLILSTRCDQFFKILTGN